MPFPCHAKPLIHTRYAAPLPCSEIALRRTAWSEHGMAAAWAWHGKCESDTAELCKSNGKDTF